MELLFVTLGGAILGAAVRYVLPRRQTQGALLTGAIGASVAAAVWAALTWAGWKFDGGWIWVVSLVAAAIVAAAVDIVLGRTRTASDEAMLQRLQRA
ncbi:MAG: hypothetical protein ABWX66_02660 [Lacisediminihabitans sp.]